MSYGTPALESTRKADRFLELLLETLEQIKRQTPAANNRTMGVAVEYAQGAIQEIGEIRDHIESCISLLGGVEAPEIIDVKHSDTPDAADNSDSTKPKSLPEPTGPAQLPDTQP